MSIKQVAHSLLQSGEVLETGIVVIPVEIFEDIVGNESLPENVFVMDDFKMGGKISRLKSSHKFLYKPALEKIAKLGR